jgi:hypothetical protein
LICLHFVVCRGKWRRGCTTSCQVERKLQATSRQQFQVVVELLTGCTTLTAHLFKIGLAWWQDCQLCGDEKEKRMHIVCYCEALASRGYRTSGWMFLTSKDLENVTVNGLIGLVANTRLGIIP